MPSVNTPARLRSPVARMPIAMITSTSEKPASACRRPSTEYCAARSAMIALRTVAAMAVIIAALLLDPRAAIPSPRVYQAGRAEYRDRACAVRNVRDGHEDRAVQHVAVRVDERPLAGEHPCWRRAERGRRRQ